MKLENLDIISSNVVVVLNPPPNPPRISPNDLRGMIRAPINIGQSPSGSLIFDSPRDQIEVMVGQGRLRVTDNSGEEPGLKPIADVTLKMLRLLDTTYRAFGLNCSLSFEAGAGEAPADFIAKIFLNIDEIQNRSGLELSGAGIRLFYRRGPKICTLAIEPEEGLKGKRVLVDLNVHEDSEEFPSHEVLHQSIREEYSALVQLLESM